MKKKQRYMHNSRDSWYKSIKYNCGFGISYDSLLISKSNIN